MNTIVHLSKPPSKKAAQDKIRELVAAGAICWDSSHLKRQMKDRGISTMQILNCLKSGTVTEEPYYSISYGGGYETAVEKSAAGEWLRVGVLLSFEENLVIITAYPKGKRSS